MASDNTTRSTTVDEHIPNWKENDEFGKRMKAYEANHVTFVDITLPFMVRLDGHGFSKFTKPFKKPYDERVHNAMVATASDLLEIFNCVTVYTQSDEITLIFKPTKVEESKLEEGSTTESPKNEKEPLQHNMFNGKVQKIVSLSASYCTVRFNYHLMRQPFNETTEQKLIEKVHAGIAYFDGRVFNVKDEGEVLNNILWRGKHDCVRNSISMLAQHYFSANQLHKLSNREMLEKLKKEKGIDWETYPDAFKYGTFVKKEVYMKEAVDQKTLQPVIVPRTRIITKSMLIDTYTPENIALMMNKYWNGDSIEVRKGATETVST